mgnify:CR=1 FL=1
METTMVDYAKYANMNARQLVNSLMTLERKEEKYREEVKNKLRDMQELAYFLKTKIKESLDSPKFVSYKDSGLHEIALELESKLTPDEIAENNRELQADINRTYDD